MLQKAAKLRLFAFNVSTLRIRSAAPTDLLRSSEFCTFATEENPRPIRRHPPDGAFMNF